MKTNKHFFPFKAALPAILASSILAATLHAAPDAEPTVDPASHAAHVAAGTMPPDAPKGDPSISELQAKVAQLEAALAKGAPVTAAAAAAAPASAAMLGMPAAGETPSASPMAGTAGSGTAATTDPEMAGMGGSGGGMGMMGMMGMMDKMDKMMGKMDEMMGMGAMPMDEAPMEPATAGDMGMDKMKKGGMGMDKMKMAGMMGTPPMDGGAPGALPQSSLPGFPGASHLYHLGATDFFLDHEAHIALTTEQTAALNKAKEQALLRRSTAERKVAQAEQELWTLTASDQPDATAIEAKIVEIEKSRGDDRLAFIRAVGEASKLLTDEQRNVLTGFAPTATTAPATAMAPMKGM